MSDYDPNDISDEEMAELEEQIAEERRRASFEAGSPE